MKKMLLCIAALLGSLSVSAQVAEDKVLLTIDGEPVYQSEFVYIYTKNNQETAIDQKSVDEYLDLFVNFKLKVKEAEQQGLDTTSAFRKELAGYRKQATPKYMEDPALEEAMVRQSYEHMSRSRRVAHICIACAPDASPELQDMALKRINEARERVTTGKQAYQKKGKKMVALPLVKEDFFAVASEVSEDPNVGDTRGEVGWVLPFRFVWPFEKAVYDTEVGQVSEPFRTAFGYHIVLVEEERPYEEVHASHIMKMCNTQIDSISRANQAILMGIHQLVADGADFAEMAKQYSDDKGSSRNGGDLGWFGRGAMVKPFEDMAFGMEPGTVSEPFATRYGWHIVKLHDKRAIQPYDSVRSSLATRVKRDERHQEVERQLVEKLRAEHGLPASMTAKEVLAYEEAHLENKYPEFRHLMQEYHDGILLFDVSLREVWDKASLDTAGLEHFFAQHKKDYKWDAPRYKGIVFYCRDANTVKAVKRLVKVADPDSLQSYIDHRMNVDSVVYVRSEKGLWKQGQNAAVDKLVWKTGDFEAPEEYPYVFVLGKKLKQPEEYADERGKITAAYQDELEKNWIAALKQKYEVVIHHEVLEALKAEGLK